MQSGLIILWHGAIVDIPDGFVLCDGNNDTPNLTDSFVVGAGDSYAVNEQAGSPAHNHTFTSATHSHTIPAGNDIEIGTGKADTTTEDSVSGTTDNGTSLPPYYALAYIMKT